MAAASVNTKLFQSIANQGNPEALAKILTYNRKSNQEATKDDTIVSKNLTENTASKIGPVDESSEMSDVLFKIYDFLKKSTEAKIKNREKENNFKEEKEYERKRRHKELMDVLRGIQPGTTATKIENVENNSIFDTLLSVLGLRGMGKIALTGLQLLGRFITGPVGLAVMGTLTVAELVSYLWKNSNPESVKDALAGKTPGGMPGQLPTYDEEQASKEQKKKVTAVDTKGIQNASLEELQAKRQELIDTGDPRARVKSGKGDKADTIKAKQIDDIEAEIQKRQTTQQESAPTQVPTTTPAPTEGPGGVPSSPTSASPAETSTPSPVSPMPVSNTLSPGESIVEETTNNLGDKLTNVTNENIMSKIMESIDTKINVVTEPAGVYTGTKKIPTTTMLPPVRNLEPTFQRMIMQSTRVV